MPAHNEIRYQIGIACIACVIAFSALHAHASNIFDEDWTPPKPVVQPHAVPIQRPPALPVPAAPATVESPGVSAPPSRRPIPDKSDQAHSRSLLKAAFAKQLKDRSIEGRKKLAQSLLDEVPKTSDNPSDQYVLLGGAIEASKDGGVLPLCFQAADTMASKYEVNGFNVKIEAALRVNLRGDSSVTTGENVRAAMELVDPLLAAEDFPTALRILTLARSAAAGDAALASLVQRRIQAVESMRTARGRLAQHLEKLKTSPDDPAANFTVGSYLCFDKAEWDKGLQLLAKCSDANLKHLATLELSHPKTSEETARLADAWWDVRSKQSGEAH